MTSVLVIGELQDGGLAPVTGELLAAAGKAVPSERPALALLTSPAQRLDGDTIASGAERVYLLEHLSLAGGGTGLFDAPVAALVKLIRAVAPDIVLFARTDFGTNVAPRIAVRLDVAVASDCVDIAIDAASGRLVATRPVHGGNALAEFEFGAANPQIAVIRPRVFEAAEPTGVADGEVERFDVSDVIGEPVERLVETIPEEQSGVRLEAAPVVVAGGRGLGGPEPFEQLRQLASHLHGAVGATRAACDAEWIDHSYQIGLTGKSVGPQLYVAIGISGASQHMAGCSGARVIVAVNRDPDAHIFKDARYGVVGDWREVLPALVSAVEELTED